MACRLIFKMDGNISGMRRRLVTVCISFFFRLWRTVTNSVRREDCLLFALRTVCCSSIMLQLRVCHFVGSYVLRAVPVPRSCSTCQNRAKNLSQQFTCHIITSSHHLINHWLYYLLNHRNISYIARRINKGFIYLKTLYLKYEFFPQSY